MRKYLLLAALFLLIAEAKAQFTITGKIAHYKKDEKLQVNIPEVYGFQKENSITIPVSANGSFTITLPVKTPKFADLIFQRTFFRCLLLPGKNMAIRFNATDTTYYVVSGTSASLNRLTNEVLPDDNLAYKLQQENQAALTSMQAITNKIINPLNAVRDERIAKVNASILTPALKALLISEIKYQAIIGLDGVRMGLSDRKLAAAFYLDLYDPLSPLPMVMPAGPNYYSYVRSYLGYLGPRALANKAAKNIKNNEPLDFYKISFDSANVVAEKYGNSYLRWILANNLLPRPVTEKLTYKDLLNLYYDKDLRLLNPLLKAFETSYPKSPYVKTFHGLRAKLMAELEANAKNEHIKIINNYKDVKSIHEVISSLKGKVIYLDIWGTWCGPCKAQIPYLPQLKAHFKNKDVVFVYFDMDEEDQDKNWKEFIKVNRLEGLHLRKNRADIAAFWDELMIKPEERAYPKYFIFDKTGKIAVSNALRPSDESALYEQIEKYLK